MNSWCLKSSIKSWWWWSSPSLLSSFLLVLLLPRSLSFSCRGLWVFLFFTSKTPLECRHKRLHIEFSINGLVVQISLHSGSPQQKWREQTRDWCSSTQAASDIMNFHCGCCYCCFISCHHLLPVPLALKFWASLKQERQRDRCTLPSCKKRGSLQIQRWWRVFRMVYPIASSIQTHGTIERRDCFSTSTAYPTLLLLPCSSSVNVGIANQ